MDRDEVESLSDAGSLDSLDSDHEIPPIDPPVITPATGARAEASECVCVCVWCGCSVSGWVWVGVCVWDFG